MAFEDLDISTGELGDDEPSFDEVLDLIKHFVRGDMRVSLPCIVTKFDDTIVDVQIPTKLRYLNGSTQDSVKILNVPICWPGGDNRSQTWPISSGDIVTVHFADQSIQELKARGAAATQLVSPSDSRRFTLNGAYCTPNRLVPSNNINQPEVSPNTWQTNVGLGGKFAVDNGTSELIGEIRDSLTEASKFLGELNAALAAIASAAVSAPAAPVTNSTLAAFFTTPGPSGTGSIAQAVASYAAIQAALVKINSFVRP